MISRRTIRIKVMQTLYALEQEHVSIQPGEADLPESIQDPSSKIEALKLSQNKGRKILTDKFEETRNTFVFLLDLIFQTALYSEKDARHRASKHLPTNEDLSVNTKIAGNTLLWQTIENPEYKSVLSSLSVSKKDNSDLHKKLYLQLVQTEEYAEYIQIEKRVSKSERTILEFILNHIILPNETAIAFLEEHFINWDDDAEQIQILISNYFQKPNNPTFRDLLGKEKRDFGFNLLQTVLDKQEFVLELIKPKLKNWDADRIASLDMILLQMGICEFLYFETIPTKVTINEFIDLARSYSTPQSGQFVNGLLDNIQKELLSQNKIHKVVYKNSTI